MTYSELRRIQLAAEASRALAVLFRLQTAAGESSPAALRVSLATTAGGLSVHILKRRGAPLDRPVLLPALLPAAATKRIHHHAVDRDSSAGTAARSAAARFAAA